MRAVYTFVFVALTRFIFATTWAVNPSMASITDMEFHAVPYVILMIGIGLGKMNTIHNELRIKNKYFCCSKCFFGMSVFIKRYLVQNLVLVLFQGQGWDQDAYRLRWVRCTLGLPRYCSKQRHLRYAKLQTQQNINKYFLTNYF